MMKYLLNMLIKISLFFLLIVLSLNQVKAQDILVKSALDYYEQRKDDSTRYEKLTGKRRYTKRLKKNWESYKILEDWLQFRMRYIKSEKIMLKGKTDTSVSYFDNELRFKNLGLDTIKALRDKCFKLQKRDKRKVDRWELLAYLNKAEVQVSKQVEVAKTERDKLNNPVEINMSKNATVEQESKQSEEAKEAKRQKADHKIEEFVLEASRDLPCKFRLARSTEGSTLAFQILSGASGSQKFVDAAKYDLDTANCDESLYQGLEYAFDFEPGSFFSSSGSSAMVGMFLYRLMTFLDTLKIDGEPLFRISAVDVIFKGGADASKFEYGTYKYSGEFGDSIARTFVKKTHGVTEREQSRRTQLVKGMSIDNYELAYLRAYSEYFIYMQLVKKSHAFLPRFQINPRFEANVSLNENDGADRYCIVELELKGAFNIIFENDPEIYPKIKFKFNNEYNQPDKKLNVKD